MKLVCALRRHERLLVEDCCFLGYRYEAERSFKSDRGESWVLALGKTDLRRLFGGAYWIDRQGPRPGNRARRSSSDPVRADLLDTASDDQMTFTESAAWTE